MAGSMHHLKGSLGLLPWAQPYYIAKHFAVSIVPCPESPPASRGKPVAFSPKRAFVQLFWDRPWRQGPLNGRAQPVSPDKGQRTWCKERKGKYPGVFLRGRLGRVLGTCLPPSLQSRRRKEQPSQNLATVSAKTGSCNIFLANLRYFCSMALTASCNAKGLIGFSSK